MSQKWKAVLAPVGVMDKNSRIISSSCKITMRDKVPLFDHCGYAIGHATDVSISDGYLVVTGVIYDGHSFPTVPPTFDFSQSTIDVIHLSTLVFTDAELMAVRIGFIPAWDDPNIAFTLL